VATENPDAVVAAIDRLTAEVALVRTALEAMGDRPSSGAITAAAAAVKSIVPQDRRTAPPSLAPLSLAPTLADAATDRNADEIEKLFAFLFMAAQDDDSEAGFENFVSVMHSDRTDAPRSIPSLKEFNWRALRKNAARYLSDPADPTSFTILSRNPESISAETNVVKTFLSCPGRSPVPVTLKRDSRQDAAFRITDSSL
jgi:hypothetical protein